MFFSISVLVLAKDEFLINFSNNVIQTGDWQKPQFITTPILIDEASQEANNKVTRSSFFKLQPIDFTDLSEVEIINQLFILENEEKRLTEVANFFDFFQLDQGRYQLETILKDSFDNLSETNIINFTIDHTAPYGDFRTFSSEITTNPFLVPYQAEDVLSKVNKVFLDYRFKNQGEAEFSEWISYQEVNFNESTKSGALIFAIENNDNFTYQGDYQFGLKFKDEAGNLSELVESEIISVDLRQTNQASVQVFEEGRLRQVEERFLNPNFSEGLDFWEASGEVELYYEYDPTDQGMSREKNFIKLGNSQDSGLLTDNYLEQTISNVEPLNGFYFWYNAISEDNLEGFDDSIFRVLVNEKVVYDVSRAKAYTNYNALDGFLQVTWHEIFINLSDFQDQFLTIRFEAGNSGDSQKNSFAYLHSITTDQMILNSDNQLYISGETNDDEITLKYNDQEIKKQNPLFHQFENFYGWKDFNYYLTNSQRITDEKTKKCFIYPGSPNRLKNFSINFEGDGEYLFEFDHFAPNIKNVNFFSSQNKIDQTSNFSQIDMVEISDFNLFNEKSRLPLKFLDKGYLLGKNLNQENYYFTAQVCDYFNNCSFISDVIYCQAGDCQNLGRIGKQTLLINEINYNPQGSDSGVMPEGEWLEIYNNSPQTLDLSGFYLKNKRNWTLEITQANSDNNKNCNDDGETIIFPYGFLTVYRNNSAFFSNNQEEVFLYNKQDQLLDVLKYQGSEIEGDTVGRLEAASNRIFNDLTPTLLNNNKVRVN